MFDDDARLWLPRLTYYLVVDSIINVSFVIIYY